MREAQQRSAGRSTSARVDPRAPEADDRHELEGRDFESLRRDGLDAYANFHAVVTDPKALADWRAGVQRHQIAGIGEFTKAAATLPPPSDGLAFSTIASVAFHAVEGGLRD